MRRHSRRLQIQTDAKPFTDFLAERHVMGAADLNVALLRGISHEKSNRLATEAGEALSAGAHKTRFHDCHVRARVSQTGCGEIRPNLR